MQKSIEAVSRGLTLRGMLHMPDKASGKVPAVIMFHGLTGNKVESHFSFVKLSRLLEEKGIASIRFDFGGSGESDGDFVDMTLSGEMADSHVILDFSKKIEGIDTARIGALGFSMGGAVASAISGTRKDEIKALCLWAPAGNIGELFENGDEWKILDTIRKTGYKDVGGLRLGINFYDDVVNVDIYEMARHFDKKVLLLHGDKDTAVPLSASERYLKYYGDKAKLHVIYGTDHTFPSVPWEKELLENTVAFFEKEL